MVDIGKKIDEYAQKYNAQLRAQERKTGRSINKYDVAQYMLSQGVLNSADLNNWLRTTEGLKNKNESERLKKMPVWQAAQAFHGGGTYLDSIAEFSIGSVMGFEKTNTGQTKATKGAKNLKTPKQQLEEQKLKQHLDSLPKAKGNPIEMTKKIDAQAEAKKIQDMTYDERKNYIMGKFLDAKDKNDKMGMLDAINEFYSYECEFLDKKFGITNAKDFLKDKSGLNRLVDFFDKVADDGNANNLSRGECLWEAVKGFGDFLDSLVGTQGFTMVVGLGGVTKAAQAIPKAGPLVSGAIQAYFGVEGGQLFVDGAQEIKNAQTKEEVREGAQKYFMGATMALGAAQSVKSTKAHIIDRKIEKYRLKTDTKLKPETKADLVKFYEKNKAKMDELLNIEIDINGKSEKRFDAISAKNILEKFGGDIDLIKVIAAEKVLTDGIPTFRFKNSEIASILELYNKYGQEVLDMVAAREPKTGQPKYNLYQIEARIELSQGAIAEAKAKANNPVNKKPETKVSDLELDKTAKIASTFIDDFKNKISTIRDEKILNCIVKELKNRNVDEAEALLDAINNFEGVYETIKNIDGARTEHADFSKYAQKPNANLRITDYMTDDFNFDRKIDGIQTIMKKHPSSEISNHLYNNYYLKALKDAGVDSKTIARCQEIKDNYNVKVLPGLNKGDVSAVFDFMESEFQCWTQASKGKAKFPPTIDFSLADAEWYDNTAAYGQSAASAYAHSYYHGAQAYSGMTVEKVKWAMRHELTHTNDLKQGCVDAMKINKIMPKKYIIEDDGAITETIDIENCKYKDEFLNAGISEEHIHYAYNNPKEFIAVASQGNMAKYSPEFKQVLIDFGMPEWELNLAPNE